MSTVVFIVGTLAFVVWMVRWVSAAQAEAQRKQTESNARAFARMSEALTDVVRNDAAGTLEARLRGVPVKLAYVTRGAGSSATSWTEVTVPAPGPAMALSLYTQGVSHATLLERNLVVDVIVGDPDFDAAFVVEAAPEAAARATLDEWTRKHLMDLRPVEVATIGDGIRVAKEGWLEDRERAHDLIDLAVTLSERSARAVEAIREEATKRPASGSTYRESVAADRVAQATQDAERAVQHVEDVKRARDKHERDSANKVLYALLVVLLIGMVCVFGLATGNSSHAGGGTYEPPASRSN